jgi:hypothetical protein
LIKLPAKISQSDLVFDFFEPTNEDVASMEPEAEQYVQYIHTGLSCMILVCIEIYWEKY